jgi:pimeloyl-ACP methyl ester carboxylesterase
VDGHRVTYRAWGPVDGRPVVLVHGGAAHAGWWDHVAPYLAADHRVVALDLTGHGDNDRRITYTLEDWAEEVRAVAALGSAAKPVVFGHSMGGFVALTAARLFGDELGGVVAIDSPVQQLSSEAKAWLARGRSAPGAKIYPTKAEIISRFRTLPADDATEEYIRAHIAAGSVKEVVGGWTWKFDPQIFFRSRMEPDEILAATCTVSLIRGERGMATTDITAMVAERLGGDVPVTLIPDSGHHIMLDQPIALIAVLQTLLGQWRSE